MSFTVIVGAVGEFVDRVSGGKVVDFSHFRSITSRTLAVRNRHGIRHVANMSVRIKVSQCLYINPNNLNMFI